jgi:hypothetical protein
MRIGASAIVFLVAAVGCSTSHQASARRSTTSVTVTTMPALCHGCSNPGQASAKQNSASSCVASYSRHTLAERTWAFDGVATSTGTGNDSRLGAVPVTTFRVDHWYKGGSGPEVTVEFSFGDSEDQSLLGGSGTRFLVAGEPRWGGPALNDPVAWGCGFTQIWTPQVEHEWATVFAK